jgi:hypothetical protein
MHENLLGDLLRFSGDLKRNVVDIPKPKDIYEDIATDPFIFELLKSARKRANLLMTSQKQDNDFLYTAAIGYPFKTEPYMTTRFSDGTYPVWYGSKNLETSIFETVFHTKRQLLSIKGIEDEIKVIRHRTVYDVFCNSILLDLTNDKKVSSQLMTDDYEFCHTLGKDFKNAEIPGFFSPSVRHRGGVNANIFKQSILSQPRLSDKLSYIFYPEKRVIDVYREDKLLLQDL